MRDLVRIGGGSAFALDSGLAVPQMLRKNPPDYMIFEQLAEGSISGMFMAYQQSKEQGYSPAFIDVQVGPYLKELMDAKVKVITNAGGLNPQAAGKALRKHAQEMGLSPKIAVIDGDTLLSFDGYGAYRDMFTNETWPEKMLVANVYFGGFPIAEALRMGADIVITGRVVDSALSLGPLIYEFGWKPSDYDQLAAGTAVGHLLECGCHATGGTFTDWLDVPNWEDNGHPIAEVRRDGTFVLTKPEGTGGLATIGTVTEQLLYEVSDPAAYLVPDVACDFTGAQMRQLTPDRVEVSGVKGKAPSGCYKVCGILEDGWRTTAYIPVLGVNAVEKSHRLADGLLTRTNKLLDLRKLGPARAIQVDHIGSGETFAVASRSNAPQTEIMLRIAFIHDDVRGATVFRHESLAAPTNACPGLVSIGLPEMAPVHRLFSFLLPRDKLQATITMDDKKVTLPPETAKPVPEARYAPPKPNTEQAGGDSTVPLLALAWARSGDKGNLYNIGVIARKPEYLPYIRTALTEKAVSDWMRHTFDDPEGGAAKRYDLPGLHALNFVMDQALGGGASVRLSLDGNAKGMAQKLLQMPVPVPSALANKWDGRKLAA